MKATTDNSPATTAKSGYHNLDEYALYQSLSKRELFILLRERSIVGSLPPFNDWTDKATQDLNLLHKHGIK